MDKPLLAYTLWLSFTAEQKRKLTRLFDIARTGEVVVHVGEMMNNNIGGVAKQDGYRPEDLYAITTEKLQELIGTEDTDFLNMVQHVIDNLDDLYNERFPEDVPQQAPAIADITVPAAAQPEPEAEFVPRDPEELLKKKDLEVGDVYPSIDTEGAIIAVPAPIKDAAEEIVTPKKKPYAKTTKAKAK